MCLHETPFTIAKATKKPEDPKLPLFHRPSAGEVQQFFDRWNGAAKVWFVFNGSYICLYPQQSIQSLHRPLVFGLMDSAAASVQELPMETPSKSGILSSTPPSASGPARSDSKDKNLLFHVLSL